MRLQCGSSWNDVSCSVVNPGNLRGKLVKCRLFPTSSLLEQLAELLEFVSMCDANSKLINFQFSFFFKYCVSTVGLSNFHANK